jgi:hypothetical protein
MAFPFFFFKKMQRAGNEFSTRKNGANDNTCTQLPRNLLRKLGVTFMFFFNNYSLDPDRAYTRLNAYVLHGTDMIYKRGEDLGKKNETKERKILSPHSGKLHAVGRQFVTG